jgi:laminin alpha 3/5
MMKDVTLNTINITNGKMFTTLWAVEHEIVINETVALVDLSHVDDQLASGNVYFGMLDFWQDQNSHLTAYGGHLSYKIDYSTAFYGEAILAADVILHGKNIDVMHSSTEQPAAGNTFHGTVKIVESNFQTLSGAPVTREQFMVLLRDLEAIYIRANYWNHGVITTVSDVSLTLADEDRDHYDLYEELDVERCECPPGYTGERFIFNFINFFGPKFSNDFHDFLISFSYYLIYFNKYNKR